MKNALFKYRLLHWEKNIFTVNILIYLKYYYTQRNDPLVAREKSFCENPLVVKQISF